MGAAWSIMLKEPLKSRKGEKCFPSIFSTPGPRGAGEAGDPSMAGWRRPDRIGPSRIVPPSPNFPCKSTRGGARLILRLAPRHSSDHPGRPKSVEYEKSGEFPPVGIPFGKLFLFSYSSPLLQDPPTRPQPSAVAFWGGGDLGVEINCGSSRNPPLGIKYYKERVGADSRDVGVFFAV